MSFHCLKTLIASLNRIIVHVPFLIFVNREICFYQSLHFPLEIGYLNRLQSGFCPGDSIVYQLIYLVHPLYQAVEDGNEACMVFLDVGNVFDKVWPKGFLHKLKLVRIWGAWLSWFESYLSNCQQRVVLDGQSSDWRQTEAGVPQG